MWKLNERSGELVIAAIIFCIGLVGALMSRAMPKGEYSVPGPGLFPAVLGTLLCGVSVALIVRLVLYRGTKKVVDVGHRYIWATTASIILISLFLERFGFILAITIFVGFLLKLLSGLRWLACILWAVVSSIAAYLFFNTLLGVQLPSAQWF
jgi:putative tricarboxylic transport membrane protein